MLLLDRSHVKELLRFVTGIKSDIQYWAMIDVVLTGKTPHNILLLGRKLEEMLRNGEGVLYVYDKTRMLGFVRHTQPAKECNETFVRDVIERLPPQSCDVVSTVLDANNLQRIEIRLANTAEAQGSKTPQSTLYSLRATRQENVLLLADDNKEICEFMKEELESFGDCVVVNDAAQVVDMYLEHVPDVIFLDINFGAASGLELLEQLTKYDKDAYIIMVTGAGTASNAVTARTRGARAFVAKPFDPARIESELMKCPTLRRFGGKRKV